MFGYAGSLLRCTGFLSLNMGFFWLQCVVFSLWRLLLLRNAGSRCTGFSMWDSGAPERGFSSCGPLAPLSHGMWNLPGPGIEPVSPALAGRFPQLSAEICTLRSRSPVNLAQAHRFGFRIDPIPRNFFGRFWWRCLVCISHPLLTSMQLSLNSGNRDRKSVV